MLFHFHDIDRDPSGQPFGGGDTFVQSFFDNTDNTFTYDPSTQGPIQRISISLDVKTTDNFELFFNIGDSTGSSLVGGGAGFFPIDPNGEFQTISFTNITQSDAPFHDFSGSDPLNFTFDFFSSHDAFNGEALFEVQADNFQIEITPVPEPTTVLLTSLGFAALARRRR